MDSAKSLREVRQTQRVLPSLREGRFFVFENYSNYPGHLAGSQNERETLASESNGSPALHLFHFSFNYRASVRLGDVFVCISPPLFVYCLCVCSVYIYLSTIMARVEIIEKRPGQAPKEFQILAGEEYFFGRYI